MKTLFVDSNIPIIASEQIGEAWATVILQEIAKGNVEATTSTLFALEIIESYWSNGVAFEGRELAKNFLRTVKGETIPLTVEDFELSYQLFQKDKDLQPREALHSATAINNDLKTVFSIDGPSYANAPEIDCITLNKLLDRLKLRGDYVDDRFKK